MTPTDSAASVNERLLAVIRTQGDVAKLGPDLGAVMALVVQRARELTRATGAVIELAEGDDMVYRAASGVLEPHLGMHLNRAGSLSGQCVRDGCALRCDDAESDPRVDLQACRMVGLRSMIVMPLRHGDSVVGVLKVMSDRAMAFDDAHLELLRLMSDLIAAAMFHATQHESGELFFRATHDALTGLANRALFFDRLRQCLERAQRESQRVGVLYIDMDGLKQINDCHGHRAGDAAIAELARRLAHATRKTDTAARLGGDEFALLLANVDGNEGLHAQRHRVLQGLHAPFQFECQPIELRASIGSAIFPDDATGLDGLLDAADRSMYDAKRRRGMPA